MRWSTAQPPRRLLLAIQLGSRRTQWLGYSIPTSCLFFTPDIHLRMSGKPLKGGDDTESLKANGFPSFDSLQLVSGYGDTLFGLTTSRLSLDRKRQHVGRKRWFSN